MGVEALIDKHAESDSGVGRDEMVRLFQLVAEEHDISLDELGSIIDNMGAMLIAHSIPEECETLEEETDYLRENTEFTDEEIDNMKSLTVVYDRDSIRQTILDAE